MIWPERPAAGSGARPEMSHVSDAFAEVLRRLDLPYISLNPGASYRGLHDSLVNYLGNEHPQLIVCLHEEHAVAVAHGYAKVTERPMAVALHSNVGLMHATMALYNAWCDRVPMLAVGATGPLDESKRRPWIDWIHTFADQGALVRDFVKWDDQPESAQAGVDSLARAGMLTRSYPAAPVYVCLDSELQEAELDAEIELPDLERPPDPPAPGADEAAAAGELLARAQRPLILVGRVGRGSAAWDARVQLAEQLRAAVLTDLKVAAGFPTDHELHPAVPGTFLTDSGRELITSADVILSLDWVDLGGTLRAAGADARVISCTADASPEFGPVSADIAISAHPDLFVAELAKDLAGRESAGGSEGWPPPRSQGGPRGDGLTVRALAAALADALSGRETCLVRLPLGWDGADLHVSHPLDYLGQDGGAGLGSGPGMAVGAALALAGSGRLPVAVLGDGDLLMASSALWTAAHYRLPLLVVVANNRSFFNDEMHQERVANARGRPADNRWIGQHIRDPDPDLAALARSLGLSGHGPVEGEAELEAILAGAAEEAAGGAAVLVDVRVSPHGYPGGKG
jgi:thiamine pyrophosphate-dependent acetolactate synthase large subunit-like protein